MVHEHIGHRLARLTLFSLVLLQSVSTMALAQQATTNKSIVHQVLSPSERLEMILSTSRILKLDQKVPRAQVGNPEIIELTPLSPYEIQIFAKSTGVTTVNLWGQDDRVYSINITVSPDARVLKAILKAEFPHASLNVRPMANSVIISGFVDRADYVSRIVRIAEDFYPKVINNISVGGVQQVLLHVKIMEVSRTKLRELGFDFSVGQGSSHVVTSISQMIDATTIATGGAVSAAGDTLRFGIVDSNSSFFGFIKALRENQLVKILAEPTLVAISGRPASFRVGGEIPILIPQSLGTVSVEYKQFGTEVHFVPIVLGNNRIRLEVRPRVSELDPTRGVTFNGYTVPAFRVREVDTAVEMNSGQTLAIAGLVQTKIETENIGLPYLSELSWLGTPFRKIKERNNEIELLILVRPELVGALDPHEVPLGGPGLNSDSPNDKQLYFHGYMEVPKYCQDGNCPHCQQQHGGGRVVEPDPAEPEVIQEGVPTEAKRPEVPGVGRKDLSRQNSIRQQHNRLRQATAPLSVSGKHKEQPQAKVKRPIVRAVVRQSQPGFIGPIGYDVN